MWHMAAVTGVVRVGVWQVEVLQVHGTRSSDKLIVLCTLFEILDVNAHGFYRYKM
jgi:hypothetical protein